MKELSIIIPASNKNGIFVNKTIESILTNMQADTEIIVVYNGARPDPAVLEHKLVTCLQYDEKIGQRAAINIGVRLSKAKYIMKLDAHCSLDEGFDKKLIESAKELGREVMQVPLQYNLHAFDWVCPDGHRRYQGPSGVCTECGKETTRDMLWKKRDNRRTFAWRFDQELHFQYWHEYEKKHPEDYVETMSLLGACWFLDRDWYWELGGCDEEHGSWGQQGTEMACKAWLSGGKLICNKKTWFAHMFRTQGGDFSFSHPISGKEVEKARAHSRELWKEGKWPKAIHDLDWLLKKFAPVPGWDDLTISDPREDVEAPVASGEVLTNIKTEGENIKQDTKALPLPNQEEIQNQNAGIVYFTDNRLSKNIMRKCKKQINKSGLPIVSASLKPIKFGSNIVLPLERDYLTMFKQILAGLKKINTDVVFLCEHDVLYHPSHFQFRPPRKDVYYYNTNNWLLRASDGHALYYDCKRLGQLCADRKFLIEHYKKRIILTEKNGFSRKMGLEPGTHNRPERIDDFKSEGWRSEFPNVDIKHDQNLIKARWKQSDFRSQKSCKNWKESDEISGWGKGSTII